MTTAREAEPAPAGSPLPTCPGACAAGSAGNRLNRRQAMRTAAVAGGAVVAGAALVACGSSGGSSGPVTLGKTADIPVGGGVIYGNHGVVVTQPTAGTFKGFSSTCTHLGCTVFKVSGGLILCPCHGSEYSVVDGSVKGGPAPTPLPTEKITVKNNQIILDA